MLGASIRKGATLAALVAAVLPAGAEPAAVSESVEPLPAASELAGRTVDAWDHLRDALLPETPDPALGRAVAVQLFQATAGIAVPGVPLPAMSPDGIPDLEFVPVRDGLLTSSFGHRRDPINGRSKLHRGVDFSADPGTPVLAAASGVVTRAEYHRGYGRVVFIDHGAGFVTRYAHLSKMVVREGDAVTGGTRIGTVGSSGRATGPHLHFELRVLGHAVDPLPALGIERRRLTERLADLLRLPIRDKRKPRRRARRHRDRS